MKRFFCFAILAILTVCSFASCNKDGTNHNVDTNINNNSQIDERQILNEGKAGESITWTYFNDNTLVFAGSGTMFEYYDSTSYSLSYPSMEMPWYEYSKIAKEIFISDGITSISNFAFFGTRGITTINLPESITYIGACAFEYSSIEEITLPKNLNTIEEYLFYHCHNLKKVTAHDNLQEVKNGAFDDCPNLILTEYDNAYYWGPQSNPFLALIKAKSTEISSCKINDKTKIIYSSAFLNCKSLSRIILHENIQYIGKDSFYRSGLTKISIPNKVEYIEYGAFRYCYQLKEVILGKSVNRIGATAFDGCDALVDVYVYGDEENWNNIIFEKSSDGYGHYNYDLINANRHYYSY
ncbi:MAG: leucine-rich repeat domain-containing protein [Clostridia bacterium]|nr:leucine-rich repeat domain-containing protein [Clostridia bacterium]